VFNISSVGELPLPTDTPPMPGDEYLKAEEEPEYQVLGNAVATADTAMSHNVSQGREL